MTPPAVPLPPNYPRHTPSRDELRSALRAVTAGTDWTALSWSDLMTALAALGRTDIGLGRLAEGHIDALRICDQAGRTVAPEALYGVWASRSGGSGVQLRHEVGQLVLNGTVRFASGAGVVDRALIPVWPGEGHHLLIDVPVAGLPVDGSAWQTTAMAVSQSHTVPLVELRLPPTAVIGRRNFYLNRPGFFPGGIGVAAVWAGGIARVLDVVVAYLGDRPWPAGELRLGRLVTHLGLALAAVRDAGAQLDARWSADSPPGPAATRELATLVRAGVGIAVRAALAEAQALAGAAGLAYDTDLIHAIDDLGLYVQQQNLDDDAAFLGAGARP